jgi:hypothetical protein
MLQSFKTAILSLQIKHKAFSFLETQKYLFVYFSSKILHSESALHFFDKDIV